MVAKPFYFSSTYAGFQQSNQLGHLDVVSQHQGVAGSWFVCEDLRQGLIWGPVVRDGKSGVLFQGKHFLSCFGDPKNSQPPGSKPTTDHKLKIDPCFLLLWCVKLQAIGFFFLRNESENFLTGNVRIFSWAFRVARDGYFPDPKWLLQRVATVWGLTTCQLSVLRRIRLRKRDDLPFGDASPAECGKV